MNSFLILIFHIKGYGVFDKRTGILRGMVYTRLGGFTLPLDCLSNQVTWFHNSKENNPLQTFAPVKIFHEHVLASSYEILALIKLQIISFEPRKDRLQTSLYFNTRATLLAYLRFSAIFHSNFIL